MLAESEDGLLLDTVQVYTPPVVTFRVCVYCAVSGLSNTVSVPSVTVMESLVQVTVVAGPPVEIQVRLGVVLLRSEFIIFIVTSPAWKEVIKKDCGNIRTSTSSV